MNLAGLVNTAFKIGGQILHDDAITLIDRDDAEITTLPVGTFIAEYVLSQEYGFTYLRVQISESAGLAQAELARAVTARFKGAVYSVARDEDPVTTDLIQKLRLTPAERTKS
jgi:hypothetical protein